MIDIVPFTSLFTLVFVAVLIISLLSVIISFVRLLRKPHGTRPVEGTSMVKEREIIREIIKIRCPYCNNLYDERYDNCPHCGGKRTI
jgi:DNA-directed RNA polymerase subunit RPC12/RpoP